MARVYMPRVYADLIKKGLKTIEAVPPELRMKVQEILDSEGHQ